MRAVLLTFALLAGCAPTSPAPLDEVEARAILRTVIATRAEARHGAMAEPVCVAPETRGTAFEADRTDRDEAARYNRWSIQRLLRQWRGPRYLWTIASEADGRVLTKAAGRLIGHRQPTRLVRTIDPADVPVPLAVKRAGENCETLTLSSPEGDGDLAFVETSFSCGFMCGHGFLYALRRDGRGWRIVAAANTWIA